MEVLESEDRLLKSVEGVVSEDVEEMDEDNLLREKEFEKEEEEVIEVKGQEVVEEKFGESLQDGDVNEELFFKDLIDIVFIYEVVIEVGEGSSDIFEVIKIENVDNSVDFDVIEIVVEFKIFVEVFVENEEVFEVE